VSGIELDRRAVRRLGVDRPPTGLQQHAQIAVRVRVTRIEGDGPPIGRDRGIQSTGGLQHDSEIVVAVGAIGREREALLDERHRVVVVPQPGREHAGKMQRVDVVRRLLEHRTVEGVGLVELLVALQEVGQGDGFVERQLARVLVLSHRDRPFLSSRTVAG
jgi:hypothetical protein